MPRWTKRLLLVSVLIALGVGGYYGGHAWLEKFVRERSVAIAEQACGPGSRITIGDVHIRLHTGLVRWSDVNIAQTQGLDDTTWTAERGLLISGHVDSIVVRGLSLWGLISGKRLHMTSFRIAHPRLVLLNGHNTDTTSSPSPLKDPLVHRIEIDSVMLDSGTVHLKRVGRNKPELDTRLDLHATGLHVDLPRNGHALAMGFSSGTLRLRDLTATLPPLYELHVHEIRLAHPDSTLLVHHLSLDPQRTPKDYGRAVRYETDLFEMHMDSLMLHGWDIAALFNDRTLRTRTMAVGTTNLNVFRDKALPDEPFKPKRMPAKLLRELPVAVDLDSLLINGLTVRYHEKDTLTEDFGEVVFNDIHAVTTGLHSKAEGDAAKVHMHVNAHVYGTAPIVLDLRTSIPDRTDHFSLHARIGALPFQAFNRMTNDLILVKATRGTIGGIDYTLEADDDRAHGRVDIEYRDLMISIRKRDGSRQENKLVSFLVNQIKHNDNLRSSGNFRHGDFEIERLKDRQIFNYTWRGLREGMLLSVMPKVVTDIQQATKGKVEDKVRRERRKAAKANKGG